MSSGNAAFTGAVLAVFLLILIYVIFGSYIEKKHWPVFHETGIAILIGFLISLCAYEYNPHGFLTIFEFNNELFFYVCLPPIIFASGFNMRRKRFFDNLGYILLFGVLGTVVTFFIFSALTVGLVKANYMTYYDSVTGEWKPLEMNVITCMLVCSLLCSSDVIAAISIVKYE